MLRIVISVVSVWLLSWLGLPGTCALANCEKKKAKKAKKAYLVKFILIFIHYIAKKNEKASNLVIFELCFARGIVAEPPKRPQRGREGDGADSPTPRSGGSPKEILLRKIQLKIKN
jgi:hypothetical protein